MKVAYDNIRERLTQVAWDRSGSVTEGSDGALLDVSKVPYADFVTVSEALLKETWE